MFVMVRGVSTPHLLLVLALMFVDTVTCQQGWVEQPKDTEVKEGEETLLSCRSVPATHNKQGILGSRKLQNFQEKDL